MKCLQQSLLAVLLASILSTPVDAGSSKPRKLRGFRQTQQQTPPSASRQLLYNLQDHVFYDNTATGAYLAQFAADRKGSSPVSGDEDLVLMDKKEVGDPNEPHTTAAEEMFFTEQGGKSPKGKPTSNKGKGATKQSADKYSIAEEAPSVDSPYDSPDESMPAAAIAVPKGKSEDLPEMGVPEESLDETFATLEEDAGKNRLPEVDTTIDGSLPGKGKSAGKTASSYSMTEIPITFKYILPQGSDSPSDHEYEALAGETAELFDHMFADFFLDIEEVGFEYVDPLPIYEVIEPLVVKFTIAAYFDTGGSLPSEVQLLDVCRMRLYKGSADNGFYLNLLNTMHSSSKFKAATGVELHTTVLTSPLTGPSEIPSAPKQIPPNSNQIFKIIIPIILLVIISIVAALLCMSWIEGDDVFEEEENDTVNKKVQSDYKEHTQYSYTDNDTAHDEEDSGIYQIGGDETEDDPSSYDGSTYIEAEKPNIFSNRQRIAPPKAASPVVHKTMTPTRLWTRRGFEAVPLADDVEPVLPHAKVEELKIESMDEDEVSTNDLVNDFSNVSKRAPIEVDKASSLLADSKPKKRDLLDPVEMTPEKPVPENQIQEPQDRPTAGVGTSDTKQEDNRSESMSSPNRITLATNGTKGPGETKKETNLEARSIGTSTTEGTRIPESTTAVSTKKYVDLESKFAALQEAREFLAVKVDPVGAKDGDVNASESSDKPSGQSQREPRTEGPKTNETSIDEGATLAGNDSKGKHSRAPKPWETATSTFKRPCKDSQAPASSQQHNDSFKKRIAPVSVTGVEKPKFASISEAYKQHTQIAGSSQQSHISDEKKSELDGPEKEKATGSTGGTLRDFWEQKAKNSSSVHP